MQYGIPDSRRTRTTWRTSTREIAEALGITVKPDQWVILEDAESDGEMHTILQYVDVVVWESAQPSTYHTLEFIANPRRTEPGPCTGPDCDHVSHR